MKATVFPAVLLFFAVFSVAQESPRPFETLSQPQISFLAEQDGEFEKKVKSAISGALSTQKGVQQGYLVLVGYGNSERSVALCLLAPDAERVPVVEAVQAAFRKVAGRDMSLDILFLTAVQLEQTKRVARPFYAAP